MILYHGNDGVTCQNCTTIVGPVSVAITRLVYTVYRRILSLFDYLPVSYTSRVRGEETDKTTAIYGPWAVAILCYGGGSLFRVGEVSRYYTVFTAHVQR